MLKREFGIFPLLTYAHLLLFFISERYTSTQTRDPAFTLITFLSLLYLFPHVPVVNKFWSPKYILSLYIYHNFSLGLDKSFLFYFQTALSIAPTNPPSILVLTLSF